MTHWTELPKSIYVRPIESRPEYIVNACPVCKSTEAKCLREWGYYERTCIMRCECNTEYVVYA